MKTDTGRGRARARPGALLLIGGFAALACLPALAHNVSESNADFLATVDGPAFLLFVYLGAKHMMTGYDHVLYLLAVVFFLHQSREVVVCVTLFAIGHSVTLIAGVLLGWQVSPSLVDAVIGLSVAYKAFENLAGFRVLFGFEFNARAAVLLFGLVHGLGLATKLQAAYGGGSGVLANLLAFNLGVEFGQLIALASLLLVLHYWRNTKLFHPTAYAANVLIMACGFAFALFHLIDSSLSSTGGLLMGAS